MSIFTVTPILISANVEKNSSAVTLAGNITSATVQLTDSAGRTTPPAGSNWRTAAGHVVKWGVQRSKDGGATWTEPDGGWFLSQTGLPFGSLNRSGGMPELEMAGDQLVSASGDQLRLAILTDAAITLGAVITTA